MIPPDTSMPVYDPPLSIWPGIITLALGILILTYMLVRITRNYRQARAENASPTPVSPPQESAPDPEP